MNRREPTVQINSSVLEWALAGSGWDAAELSEKADIELESMREQGKQSATIRVSDLRKISEVIKRPVSVLLLPEPPAEKDLPYYRRVDGTGAEKLSRETLAVIRNAKYAQSIAGELLEMRSEDAQPDIAPRTLKDDPETIAEAERKALGLGLEKRPSEESIDTFVQNTYRFLKDKIESLNIFVMQASMDVGEARGFALADGYPKVILVNSRDRPRPRLFTLLHEYAHLLLETDGICLINPNDTNERLEGRHMSVERWCNDFAGAVIMPKNMVLEELDSRADQAPDRVVSSLSRKFCSSIEATIVRILNLLDGDPRKKKYLEYYGTVKSKPVPETGGGGGDGRNMARECVNRHGTRYVRLVSDSRARDLITTNDMIRYLGLKTKHFDKLEELI